MQKRESEIIKGLEQLPCDTILQCLKGGALVFKKMRVRIKNYVYKIMQDMERVDGEKLFLPRSTRSNKTGNWKIQGRHGVYCASFTIYSASTFVLISNVLFTFQYLLCS